MRAEVISGDGVALVPVPPERADAVLAGGLDGYVAGPGWPHDDTVAAFSFRAARGSVWLITVDGVIVGDAGTKGPPDADGAVEIGYGLAGPSRGRGIGTRAVAALTDWLAGQDEVSVIVAHVDAGNEPSHRLLARLGFTPTGRTDAGEERYERSTLG